MSLAGLLTFEENLRKLMASRAFHEADDAQRIDMGRRLLNSRYGLGSVGGWGCAKVKPLPVLPVAGEPTTHGSPRDLFANNPNARRAQSINERDDLP